MDIEMRSIEMESSVMESKYIFWNINSDQISPNNTKKNRFKKKITDFCDFES